MIINVMVSKNKYMPKNTCRNEKKIQYVSKQKQNKLVSIIEKN